MFTWGKIPYAGWTNKETMDHLTNGERLGKPDECPSEIYEIMLKCWNKEPSKRPTFESLCESFNKILVQYERAEGKVAEESNNNNNNNNNNKSNYETIDNNGESIYN